jgi:hypothetical protein
MNAFIIKCFADKTKNVKRGAILSYKSQPAKNVEYICGRSWAYVLMSIFILKNVKMSKKY